METLKTKLNKQDKEKIEQWLKWSDELYSRNHLKEKSRMFDLLNDYLIEMDQVPLLETCADSLMFYAFISGLENGKELEANKRETNNFLERLWA